MQISTIQSKIHEIRGVKVMLDFDLASIYEVETRALNQAVKRNPDLFPEDFMFKLTTAEWETMSSQIVMTSPSKRPKSALPLVFTEHGVAMLSNVLHSNKAKQTSVAIIRVFIALRQFTGNYNELSLKILELEAQFNRKFKDIFDAINYLLQKDQQQSNQQNRKKIGYK